MRHVMHKQGKGLYPVVDGLALLVGVSQPVMTIPQIVILLEAHDSSQISFWTWFTYDIASVVLLIYGIKHQLWPIIVAQILWLIVQTALIVLVFTL